MRFQERPFGRLLSGRKKLHWRHAAQTVIMPKKGFTRLLNYFWHRVARLKASPYNIAAGFACGAAVSFTPLLGLHVILAIGVAWIIRGNIIASLIGTLVGNPWTFPFIWFLTYYSGIYILEGGDQITQPDELLGFDGDVFLFAEFFFTNLENLIIPMFVGSLPFLFFSWIGCFAVCYLAVSKYHAARQLRMQRKRQQQLEELQDYDDLPPPPNSPMGGHL